jgi:hypothetical protein
MDRRRTLWYVLAAVVVVIAVLAAIGAMTDDGDGDDNGGTGSEPTGELTAAADEAGCLPVEKEELGQPKHRTGEIDYDTVPPAQGDHSPNTLRNTKRFYSRDDNPPPEGAVHDLEHGLVVAWYDDELPDDQVKILEESAQGMSNRYVVVPWSRSDFEAGRHVVLTAWGVRQRCERVSVEHIQEFIDDHADTDAPEKGYGV